MKKLMMCLAIMFTVATMATADFHTFGTSGGAFDMPDDGSIIVGQTIQPGAYIPTAFKYTDADGVTDLGLLAEDLYGTASSIANDVSEGGVVVGWSGETGPGSLPGFPRAASGSPTAP